MSDLISRQAAEEKLKKVVDEMALIFADIREKNVDDSVCGLCEYDCDHGIDGCANECPGFERDDCFKLKEEYRKGWTDLSDIPSVEPERKPGKWLSTPKGNVIMISDEMADISLRLPTALCSNCGEVVPVFSKWKRYCSMCGSPMRGEDD